MTIGPDIQEALAEIGLSVSIIKDNRDNTDTVISGEYLVVKTNNQATKPFIREFFMEGQSSYDTDIQAGDVVLMNNTGIKFLVMNSTPVLFEDEVIKNDIVLYKSNVSGEIQRLSGEAWTRPNLRKIPVWRTIRENAYALQTEGIYGNADLPEAPIGMLPEVRHELYIPSSYGIQELDRYQTASGEYYRVEAVFHRRYQNIDVAILQKDTR